MNRLLLATLLLVCLLALVYLFVMNPSSVWPRVTVNGQSFAGLPFRQVEEQLSLCAHVPGTFALVAGGATVPVPLTEANVTLDRFGTARRVIRVGHELEPHRRAWSRLRALLGHSTDVAPRYRVADPRLLQRAVRRALRTERSTELHVGKAVVPVRLPSPAVSDEAAAGAVVAAIQEGEWTAVVPSGAMAPDLNTLSAVRTAVASAVTPIVSRDAGSRANMARAAEIVTGQVIWPGQTWSFNQRVPRTAAWGFVEGGILEAPGRPGRGVGGGVCQVSTTLFIGALKAGLEIVERRSHSALARYAPGLDATVNAGTGRAAKDLKLRNPFRTPIVMVVAVDLRRNECTATFFGAPTGRAVRLHTVRGPDGTLSVLRLQQLPDGRTVRDTVPPDIAPYQGG